jgi:membrane protein DedA with SNARE-associated domain
LSLSDYLLSELGIYGLPLLFVVLLVGCAGIPLPASFLLLAAGSFVAQDELSLWPVLGLASAGAVIGDNIGYALGRWGGRRMFTWLPKLFEKNRLNKTENWLKRWGGSGIFFSRWLLTPLGPVVNITSGLTHYSWPRFLVYCVTGEALWVLVYVLLGKFFSGQVQAMSEFFGDFTWVMVGLLVVFALGWSLFKFFRSPPEGSGSQT